tara:strand:- start:725 stop:1039 length:315 start_codon:yes stop_codon:yes gene_type:complete
MLLMLDVLGMVGALERPKLLVNAARFGLDDYDRERHLRRVLRTDHLPRPAQALMMLLDLESVMDGQRTAKQAEYGIARHLDLLIAIMGEARILRATSRPSVVAT